MIEILEAHRKLFRKIPYKIVFRIELSSLSPKSLFLNLLNGLDFDNQNFLSNLRGRPIESFDKNPENLPKNSEELLSVHGDCGQNLEFCYTMTTAFTNYTNDGKIAHSLSSQTNGALANYEINIARVCNWMPLRISGFRLGMESYSRFFLGSMLGAVPSIESRFYIEAKKNQLWVLLESSNSVISNPMLLKLNSFLEKNNILNDLVKTLKEV